MILTGRFHATELDAAQEVASYLAARFVYTPDEKNAGCDEHWRSREEIEAKLLGDGALHDDCDGHAMAAVYLLADLGVKARVVLCWCEPGSGPNPYHAVCETESGYVLDNRDLGRVLTWSDRPLNEYTRDRMSGFFEFGEVGKWQTVAREAPPA